MLSKKFIYTVSVNGVPIGSYDILVRCAESLETLLEFYEYKHLFEIPSYQAISQRLKKNDYWKKDNGFNTLSITKNHYYGS